jgi:hypothetical protein
MSSDDIAVEIYDELVTDLPDPLKYASYEMHLYDFREDITLVPGWYKYRSAHAQVVARFPGSSTIYEVAVEAAKLYDMNELYRLIVAGDLLPFQP